MTPDEIKEIKEAIKESSVDWKSVYSQAIELNTKSTEAIALVKDRTDGLNATLNEIKNKLPTKPEWWQTLIKLSLWPIIILILGVIAIKLGGCIQLKDLFTAGICN